MHFTPGQNGVAPVPQAGADHQHTAVHASQHTSLVSIDASDHAHWRIEFDDHEDGLPKIEEVEIRITPTRNGQNTSSAKGGAGPGDSASRSI